MLFPSNLFKNYSSNNTISNRLKGVKKYIRYKSYITQTTFSALQTVWNMIKSLYKKVAPV